MTPDEAMDRVRDLTPRQPDSAATSRRILDAIEGYQAVHGYAPSYREIGERVGLSSTATVVGHLRRLKARGLVDWTEGKVRTVRVLS